MKLHLTSKDEFKQTMRRRRHVSFGGVTDVNNEREKNSYSNHEKNAGSRLTATVNFVQNERSAISHDRQQRSFDVYPCESDKFDGRTMTWQDYLVHL